MRSACRLARGRPHHCFSVCEKNALRRCLTRASSCTNRLCSELLALEKRAASALAQRESRRRKEARANLTCLACIVASAGDVDDSAPAPPPPHRPPQACAYASRVSHALRRARDRDRTDAVLTQWRLTMTAPDWRAPRLQPLSLLPLLNPALPAPPPTRPPSARIARTPPQTTVYTPLNPESPQGARGLPLAADVPPGAPDGRAGRRRAPRGPAPAALPRPRREARTPGMLENRSVSFSRASKLGACML